MTTNGLTRSMARDKIKDMIGDAIDDAAWDAYQTAAEGDWLVVWTDGSWSIFGGGIWWRAADDENTSDILAVIRCHGRADQDITARDRRY